MDLTKLSAPFPPERVSWRVGSTNKDKTRGMALAYIDARDVMERLDGVCGVEGWQCRYPHAATKTVCEIGIRIGDEWVWKADGAGDSDVEAEKGALSDAFKRAAVKWGIGRYLYDIASPWVAIEPHGKSYAITAAELGRLAGTLRSGMPSPKEQPVAEPSNAALDEAAIVADLTKRMGRVSSAVAFDALKKDPTFLTDYRTLTEAGRSRVNAAGERRKAELERLLRPAAEPVNILDAG